MSNPTGVATWYTVNRKAEPGAAVEVGIYDEIGAFGVTASQFVREIKAINAPEIVLRLNTPGGEVFDATAIYNALREHPARVVVHVDGLAASAGSVIAMSGDEIRMADNAYLMIHNAHGGVMGEASDVQRYADLLEDLNDTIAGFYEKKAGKDRSHWRGLMDAETWFTAEEAKAEGLADSVYTAAPKQVAAKAAFDFKVYNKIPDPVRQMWGLPPAVLPNPQAPEASPCGDPPSATTKEVPPMSEPTQANPAPVPAAASTGTPQEQSPVIAAALATAATSGTVQEAISHFKAVAGPQYVEHGRQKGLQEAAKAATDRLRAILAVCPGKPQMAIDAFLSGQGAESVKLAFDAAAEAEGRARDEAAKAQLEIVRLNTLLNLGGHPGVNLGLAPENAEDVEEATGMEPKAQAEYEWDHKPSVRRGISDKEHYVAFRVRQLKGSLQTA